MLGLGWFALVYRQLGPGPLVAFFFRENLERFAGEAYDVGRPFWFYPPAYLAEGLPWSPFLPIALWRLLRSREGDEAQRTRFLAVWAALVLVPLSLSRGKIDYYLLPIYPAVSLVIGRYFASVPWKRADRAWASLVLMVEAAALVLVLALPPRIPDEWLPGALPRVLLVAVVAAGAAAPARRGRAPDAAPRRGRARLAGRRGWLVLVVSFLPAFAAAQPNRAIVADVARERSYRPDLQDGLLLRPDPREARRAAARPPGGVLRVRPVEPRRLPRAVPPPRDPGAGRVLPRRPPLPRGRPLPLRAGERAHARGAVLGPRAGRGGPRRELHDERSGGRAQEEARVPLVAGEGSPAEDAGRSRRAGAAAPVRRAATARKASAAAATVRSISASPWASETNAASNCAGGR